MPKIDPLSFARPKANVGTFTFVDPRRPETPLTMTFRSPDIVDISAVQDKVTDFMAQYSGSGKSFPAIDGRAVTLSFAWVEKVAYAYILQTMPNEDCYSMEELVVMSVTMPTVFGDISKSIANLIAESELGKLLGVQLSLEPSSVISDDIPN